MQTESQLTDCIGQPLVDEQGNKIGEIKDVYLDQQTRRPEWFAVKTGLFGNRLSFVPTANAFWSQDDKIAVPYDKGQVKDAPHAEPDGELSDEEERMLYDHYGIKYGDQHSSTGLPEGGKQRDQGQTGRTSDSAMTRSEEEMVTGTRKQEAGRARLIKYVETEHRTVTIPIQRERAKLVTEPITDANRDEALSGQDIRENAHEETLYEEEPVVEKRTVPKERVRLEKESRTDQEQVEADLRKEKIRTEGDVEQRSNR